MRLSRKGSIYSIKYLRYNFRSITSTCKCQKKVNLLYKLLSNSYAKWLSCCICLFNASGLLGALLTFCKINPIV